MKLWRKGSDFEAAADAPEPTDVADFLARVDRHYRRPLIHYFERRIREVCDIDDLVQEVFIRLLCRSSSRNIEHLEGYVFQTAANVARDRLRRRAVRHAGEHEPLEDCVLPANDFSPERVWQARQQLQRALDALAELPPRTLEIFVARLYEGLTLEEIAENLGMSVEGVRFHLRRAKAHVTRRVEQKGR